MHLVIVSYPYHYHITQVALRKAQEVLKPDVTTILWDDAVLPEVGYDFFKTNFLNDAEYRAGIIPFSAYTPVTTEPVGWIRQQLAKLNVHHYLSGDEWVVMDGDTLVNQFIEPEKFCYVNPGDPPRRWHDWFTDYLLDLDNHIIEIGGRPATSSSVPIKRVQRDILFGLDKRIHKLHGCGLSEVYHSFTLQQNREKYLEISEWEILTYYESLIGRLLPLLEAAPRFLNADEFVAKHSQHQIAVLSGRDNLPHEWYNYMGIQVNLDLWNAIYPLDIAPQ